MPIEYNEIEKRYVYREPANEIIFQQMKNINLLFTDFINRCYTANNVEITYDTNAIYDIVIHVDKRKTHAKLFHDIEKPNEYRNIALYCYWIVRLHPFNIVLKNENTLEIISDINETFAVYLYMRVIKSLYGPDIKIDYNYVRELKYTLRYRELNKATLILLLEPKIGIAQFYAGAVAKSDNHL